MLKYGLAITLIALSVLGMAFAAVAAPYSLNPGNATAPAQQSARFNILASDPMQAEIASRITISAKRLVGLSVTGSPRSLHRISSCTVTGGRDAH